VAIHTGTFDDHVHFRGHSIPCRQRILDATCIVFGGADKLDDDKNNGEGKEDFFYHGVKVRKRENRGMAVILIGLRGMKRPLGAKEAKDVKGLKRLMGKGPK